MLPPTPDDSAARMLSLNFWPTGPYNLPREDRHFQICIVHRLLSGFLVSVNRALRPKFANTNSISKGLVQLLVGAVHQLPYTLLTLCPYSLRPV